MNSIKHIVLALVLASAGLGVASAAGKATKKPVVANCCKVKKGGSMMACCKTKSKSSKGKATVMACCKEHMGKMGGMDKKPSAMSGMAKKPAAKPAVAAKPAAKPADAAKPAAKPEMKPDAKM